MKENDIFRSMLANERSFDRLFCDCVNSKFFTACFNASFTDDPVFSHIIIEDTVTTLVNPASVLEQIITDSLNTAKRLNFPVSIFVDKYLPWSEKFEKIAIDFGLRIGERMNLLSKMVETVSATRGDAKCEITTDADMWNEVFMSSYKILESWREELLAREKSFVQDSKTLLLLAREKGVESKPSGCLLIHIEPRDWAGIYCVGTLPEKRHRGIAREMLLTAESLARERGCRFLTLQTIESDGVTPMYQKLGYKVEFQRDILQMK